PTSQRPARGGRMGLTRFEGIWEVPDRQVAAGRFPGYTGAVRIGGTSEVRAGGTTALDPASAPMAEETQFRIASLTKVFGGVLTLGLVEDGVLALDDPVSRWLPEMAAPRVLVAP